MATSQRRTRPAAPSPASAPPVARRGRQRAAKPSHAGVRIQLVYRDITELKPYDFNPRDNAAAIDSLANSIRNFGFVVPVVVASDGTVAAGHTRIEAAKKLGMIEVPTIIADHLTEEQLNAFRLIDNKVAELAKWDFDLLSGEIAKLKDSGIQLTDFGWSREELDCLGDIVKDDCLSTDGLIDAAATDRMRRTERRAPATARFVMGEVVFFIPATEYRAWIDGLRTLHDYDEVAIARDIRDRLGLPHPQ